MMVLHTISMQTRMETMQTMYHLKAEIVRLPMVIVSMEMFLLVVLVIIPMHKASGYSQQEELLAMQK